MAEYQFGSIVDRNFRLTLQRLADEVNVQGKTIQDLVAEGQLTEEQYAHLITVINGLLKSGDVGKYDLSGNLRNDIDSIKNKIDRGNVSLNDLLPSIVNLINGKINRGEVSFNDLSPSLINIIEGIDGEGINVLSVPRTGSVSPEKTTFMDRSTNIYNFDEKTLNHRVSNANGSLVEDGNYHTSDFIPTEPQKDYSFMRFNNIAFYDDRFNFIAGESGPSESWQTTPFTRRAPQNAYYMRASHASSSGVRDVYINDNSDILPYRKFYQTIKKEHLPEGIRMLESVITQENERWSI